MRIIETGLPGLVVIEPKIFQDRRGFFFESYHYKRYVEHGIGDQFVQDNHSRSIRGTLRGLHYQINPGQAKLVRVVVGEVFDVAVDLRVGSPTYGQWHGQILSAENKLQMYIPIGFAHGFCVLSEVAEFEYKCSSYYSPPDERGIIWNDPDLNIQWPISNPILSDKDARLPRFKDIAPDFHFQAP